jgi:UDP-3-O-[3-hydroxymyristoyl] glucosamine N-acyltransferase
VDGHAWVAEDAVVDGARVEAFAWVGPGARVGKGSWLEAGVYVGEGVEIGQDCHLMAHSVVCAGCRLGNGVRLNPGAVVGGEGFGFVPQPQGHVKIPQVGVVELEDDVEVGSNTCIDRATLGVTRVKRGAKLDNLVQVGHNVEIGEGCFLVSFSGVAGSSRLGRGVVMAARAGVTGHLEIGDGVQIGPAAGVLQDQPPGIRVSGIPAFEHGQWLRASTVFRQLPKLMNRLRDLEARLAELEKT